MSEGDVTDARCPVQITPLLPIKFCELRKHALPAAALLHKEICRSLSSTKFLSREFPLRRRQCRDNGGVSIGANLDIVGLHRLMGSSARFDRAKKTRLVDNASVRVDDDPVVGKELADRFRVVLRDGSREFLFQFQ